MNSNEMSLWRAVNRVKNGFEQSMTITVADIEFSVTTNTVNRKCYDHMTTPTLMIKANGKRTSYNKAMGMLA